ncbi:MAG TPA: tetratricopeptide repeat protein, partial [Polyangiaceae bacterium]
LRTLVECAPAVVPHAELAQRAWGPRRVVTPETLAQSIGRLRHALGDSAASPRYIESLRGHGYRLVPAARLVPRDERPAADTAAGKRASRPGLRAGRAAAAGAAALAVLAGAILVPRVLSSLAPVFGDTVTPPSSSSAFAGAERLPNSIAVLPLELPRSDLDGEAFANAIHAALLHQLGRRDELNVIARASVTRHGAGDQSALALAEALDVELVLKGGIHALGGTQHVIVELVHGENGRQLWSGDYPADMSDPVTVLRAMTADLAGVLTRELGLERALSFDDAPTDSSEAWAFYLRAEQGLRETVPVDERASLAFLDQAIRLDPEFAYAYALRALFNAYALDVHVSPADAAAIPLAERARRVHADVERALALDPRNELAHWSLGIAAKHSWNLRAARAHFERALELNPNHATLLAQFGLYRVCVSGEPEGRADVSRALRLDPQNAFAHEVLGRSLICLRDRPAAYAAFARAVELEPISFRRRFFRARFAPGVIDDEAAYRQLKDLEPYLSDARVGSLAPIGSAYRELGRHQDAERLFERFSRLSGGPAVNAATRAFGYLIVGERERAQLALEQAVDNLGPGSSFMLLHTLGPGPAEFPALDQPQFQALRDRIRSRD